MNDMAIQVEIDHTHSRAPRAGGASELDTRRVRPLYEIPIQPSYPCSNEEYEAVRMVTQTAWRFCSAQVWVCALFLPKNTKRQW